MQANQTPVIWTVVICSLALLIAGAFVYTAIPTAEEVASQVDVPTDAEIQLAVNTAINSAVDKIDIPTIDNSKLDRVCELTDGCEFYEIDYSSLSINDRDEAEEDFMTELSDLVGIDEDYLVIDSFRIQDEGTQVRAYTEDDKDDENWEVKVFAKVRYHDLDDECVTNNYYCTYDVYYKYILITSVLDEGDYDSLSIELVNRNFEFD